MARKNTTPVEVRVAAQEKRAQALQYRLAGKTQSEITELMGVNKSTVSRWISDAIADITRESAEEWVQLINQRFDAMLAGIWNDASHGDTWKIDRALAIEDQRAKLLGLYKHAELKVVADAKGNTNSAGASMIVELFERLTNNHKNSEGIEDGDQ